MDLLEKKQMRSDFMDAYMPMSTSKRHNEIITSLIIKLASLIEQRKIHVWHEESSLVFWGKKTELCSLSLVDIERIADIESFRDNVINELYCVQPDFMLFQHNKYIENKKRTRTAGCPDLIIEIWSDGNSEDEKTFKKFLNSTSDKTEHWYIEQDSNEVNCFFGKKTLPKQSLSNILHTKNGIEVDLRRMAIE
ncbi:MAG: Uma2 family endonuclease [Oscillospiraceae bacterium]|nr:Uma2 family endonuclease [Oscillospiraceae bacterium]